MSFRDDAQLDTSQVDDRRGRGMGSLPGGIAIGGGGIGLILLVVAVLLGANPFDTGGTSSPYSGLNEQTTDGQTATGTLAQNCRTGADANVREDCRIVAYVNSIQRYWTEEFGRRGSRYVPSQTTFFTGATQTGCGPASSEVGPFYCPADQRIYIDLGFFDELRTRFGASAGSLAQGYVIAHEYGHHIQDLIGTLDSSNSGSGPQSESVRTELQADCFAGVWAGNAVQTGYLNPLTEAQINDALSAAAAVGDDRIQQQTQGRVNKERWTHGSSEQRQRWFMTGYQSGDMSSCDTFRGSI
jgi:predicted metalloprotease